MSKSMTRGAAASSFVILVVGLALGLALAPSPGRADDGEDGSEEIAPPPFTAAQIREASRPGRRHDFQMVQGGSTMIMRMECISATEEKLEFRQSILNADGTESGRPPRVSSSTWDELVSHARYPKAKTKITEESVTVKAGTFACLLYVITETEDATTTIHRYWFAKDLPGPPIKQEIEEDGKVDFRWELVAYDPGKKKD